MSIEALTIKLGDNLTLPRNATTQTYGFIARKGAGKTYAAGVLVEGAIGLGAPVIVIDPVGNWYGLRLAADGKKPGLPVYVFGGEHGDLPLEAGRGEDVARVIVERNVSAVVDVSQFRKNERKRFVTAFAECLFHEAKRARTARMIVFEEAQVFAPQRAAGGDEARLLGAVEDIVRLGRNYGLGSVLISQRPQSVNKEVLNQVELLAVGQLSGPQERKAIEQWIVAKDGDTKLLNELPRLPVGTMVVWSPQWLDVLMRTKIARKQTYDASSTPELGNVRSAPGTLAPVDVKGLRQALDLLAAKPVAVTGKGASKAAAAAPAAPIDKVAAGELVHLRAQVEQLRAQLADRDERLSKVDELVAEVEQFTGQLRGWARARPAPPTQGATPLPTYLHINRGDQTMPVFSGQHDVVRARPAARVAKAPKPTRAQAAATDMPPGQVALLQVTARFPGTLTKAQIARGAKIKITGGTFRTYWTALKSRGYIEPAGEYWRATDAGLAALGQERPKVGKTFDARYAFWQERLAPGALRLLNALIDMKDNQGLQREELAAIAGMAAAGGSFRTYATTLSTNRLIARKGDRFVVHPWLLTGKE